MSTRTKGGRYATKSAVPAQATQMEIQALVGRYGGQRYTVSIEEERARIGFALHDRTILLSLPLPRGDERRFGYYRRQGYEYARAAGAARELWEQACRANWRALLLVVRAKLEAIELGIMDVDEAFFGERVTDTGETVRERHEAAVRAQLPQVSRLSLGDGR